MRKWKKKKKTNLGPDFGLFGPNLGAKKMLLVLTPLNVRHCCKPLLYAISQKTNEQNLRKWQKKLVSETILAPLAQIQADNFFSFKNLASAVLRYHGQLSSFTISEKTNDSISRNFSDRWMDRPMDRPTA